MKRLSLILLSGLLISITGCKTEPTEEPVHLDLSEEGVLALDCAGGETRLELTHNRAWESSLSSGAEEWLSVGSETGTDGKTTIILTAEPNTDKYLRDATVVFISGGLTETLALSQDVFSFEITPKELDLVFPDTGETKSVTVATTSSQEWTWSVDPEADWLTIAKEGKSKLTVTATQNEDEDDRSATVTIELAGQVRPVAVTQSGNRSWEDKSVSRLQSATVGAGVNLVIMGDGYTAAEFGNGGRYAEDMNTAMEHFFSVYPYSDYRDYFNVWMIVAESKQTGISVKSQYKYVDTVFGSTWEGGGSTGIDADRRSIVQYSKLIMPEAGIDNLDEVVVIIPINADIYAGTCHMDDGMTEFAFGLCPVSSEVFHELVVHEVGGHAFAKLMDEYVYYSQSIPAYYSSEIKEAKEDLDWFINVDFYADIAKTTWAEFEGVPGYDMVATFEGSYMYARGIWRPEFNSCMNDNVFYFNAPSRWAQMQRIHEWAGIDYSFEQFLEDDIIPPYPTETRSGEGVLKPFVPFAPPVLAPMPGL